MAKDKLIGHLASGGAYIIFGLNVVFCKDIANSGMVSPISLFTLRAIGAALLFWVISLFTPQEKVPGRDLLAIFAASLIGLFAPQFTFLSAITRTTAIDASILSTLSPIFTMFIAAAVLREPITVKKAGGVALSFAGVLLLIFNSTHASNGVEVSSGLGIALMLLNGLSFATYLGIFRPLISKYSVITFMKWMFLFALLAALPFSFRELMEADYAGMPVNVGLEIAFVIVFATFVAYFLIPVGQKNLRPTLVSMYSYLQPVVAAAVAVISGIDSLCWQKFVAMLLIGTGVVLVNRSRAAGS